MSADQTLLCVCVCHCSPLSAITAARYIKRCRWGRHTAKQSPAAAAGTCVAAAGAGGIACTTVELVEPLAFARDPLAELTDLGCRRQAHQRIASQPDAPQESMKMIQSASLPSLYVSVCSCVASVSAAMAALSSLVRSMMVECRSSASP